MIDVFSLIIIMSLFAALLLGIRYRVDVNIEYVEETYLYRKNAVINEIALKFILLVLFIIMAFRSVEVGKDLSNYKMIFELRVEYFHGDIKSWGETGFFVLNYLIGLFTNNFQTVLIIYSFITIAGPVYLIRKYSRNSFYSIFLYVAMGFLAMSLSAIRTAIAISILCFALQKIVDGRPLPFIIFVILATCIHRTSIVFLVMYPLAKRKMTKFNVIIHMFGTLCLWLFRKPIFSFLVKIPIFQKYSSDIVKTGAFTYAFMIFVFFMLMLIFYKNVKESNKNIDMFYNLVSMAFTSQVLASMNSNISRLTNMFYIFAIILIPNVIEDTTVKCNKIILYFGITCIIVLAYIVAFAGTYGTGNYTFFWEVKI